MSAPGIPSRKSAPSLGTPFAIASRVAVFHTVPSEKRTSSILNWSPTIQLVMSTPLSPSNKDKKRSVESRNTDAPAEVPSTRTTSTLPGAKSSSCTVSKPDWELTT